MSVMLTTLGWVVLFLHGAELFIWNNHMRKLKVNLKSQGMTLRQVLVQEKPMLYWEIVKDDRVPEAAKAEKAY